MEENSDAVDFYAVPGTQQEDDLTQLQADSAYKRSSNSKSTVHTLILSQ